MLASGGEAAATHPGTHARRKQSSMRSRQMHSSETAPDATDTHREPHTHTQTVQPHTYTIPAASHPHLLQRTHTQTHTDACFRGRARPARHTRPCCALWPLLPCGRCCYVKTRGADEATQKDVARMATRTSQQMSHTRPFSPPHPPLAQPNPTTCPDWMGASEKKRDTGQGNSPPAGFAWLGFAQHAPAPSSCVGRAACAAAQLSPCC